MIKEMPLLVEHFILEYLFVTCPEGQMPRPNRVPRVPVTFLGSVQDG